MEQSMEASLRNVERQRELASWESYKRIREEQTAAWVVVQHSSGPAGGYVARRIDHEGRFHDAANYSGATILKTYKREHAAWAYADKLNAGKVA